MKLILRIVLLVAGAVSLLAANVTAQNRINGKIAFDEVQPFGDSQIYIANADGSGITQLPSPTSCLRNERPKWSPDGTKLVFSSNCDGNGMQIYSENSDGTNRIRLTNNPPADDTSPVWSPDGRTIAFVSTRDSGQFHIYLMNADGTNQRRLTATVGLAETDPNWFPDGSKIVYTRPPSVGSSPIPKRNQSPPPPAPHPQSSASNFASHRIGLARLRSKPAISITRRAVIPISDSPWHSPLAQISTPPRDSKLLATINSPP